MAGVHRKVRLGCLGYGFQGAAGPQDLRPRKQVLREVCVCGGGYIQCCLSSLSPGTVLTSFLPSRLRVAEASTSGEENRQAVETWNLMLSRPGPRHSAFHIRMPLFSFSTMHQLHGQ